MAGALREAMEPYGSCQPGSCPCGDDPPGCVPRLTLALQATDQQTRTLCEEKMTRTEFTLQSASPETEQTWTIGRNECDVQMGVVSDMWSKVSRKHCEVTFTTDGTWRLKHLGTWPTLVGGKRVVEAELKHGTTVVFGDERFPFVCRVDTSAVADKAEDPSSFPGSLFPDDNNKKAMTFEDELQTKVDPMKAALELAQDKNRVLVDENSDLRRQLLDVVRNEKERDKTMNDFRMRVIQEGRSREQLFNRLAIAEQANGEYEQANKKLKERIRALEEGNEAYKKEAAYEHAKAKELASTNEQLNRTNEQLKRRIDLLETDAVAARKYAKSQPQCDLLNPFEDEAQAALQKQQKAICLAGCCTCVQPPREGDGSKRRRVCKKGCCKCARNQGAVKHFLSGRSVGFDDE